MFVVVTKTYRGGYFFPDASVYVPGQRGVHASAVFEL